MLASCSEWNTDTLGHKFWPANSQVRNFTHLAYLEYSADGARLWGAAADELTVRIEGHHVEIRNNSDSLALLVYGYPDAKTQSGTLSDASLVIHSRVPYALYLNGLALSSKSTAVISSQGEGECHIVLPKKAQNTLNGAGQGMCMDCPVNLTGQGSLVVNSDETCITAASLRCQYGVSVTLNSASGDGICLLNGTMRSTQGTWTINAGGDGIITPDSIVLYAGTYQGMAINGSFLNAHSGVFVRRPQLMAVAARSSQVLDSAYVAQRYDSVQSLWQGHLSETAFMADTTYYIFRNSEVNNLGKLTLSQDIKAPWFMMSDGKVLAKDTLFFSTKSKR